MMVRCRPKRLLIRAMLLVLAVLPGCAGRLGGGAPSNQNSNDNGADSDPANNGNGGSDGDTDDGSDNGQPGGGFGVSIAGLPTAAIDIAGGVTLSAVVTNSSDKVDFVWSTAPAGLATLDDATAANPTLTAVADGQVEVTVMVTDRSTGTTAQASGLLQIAGPPLPPAEATIDVLPIPPATPGTAVVLQANITGPSPESIMWDQDFVNYPDDPAVVTDLVNIDNGIATFTAPTLLEFSYTLHFTVIAEYDNGSRLSGNAEVFIMGGG